MWGALLFRAVNQADMEITFYRKTDNKHKKTNKEDKYRLKYMTQGNEQDETE